MPARAAHELQSASVLACMILRLHPNCLLSVHAPVLAGHLAMGRTGFYAVAGLAFTEFFGDSLIVLIVMWQELATLLPAHQGACPSAPIWLTPAVVCPVLPIQACVPWVPRGAM